MGFDYGKRDSAGEGAARVAAHHEPPPRNCNTSERVQGDVAAVWTVRLRSDFRRNVATPELSDMPPSALSASERALYAAVAQNVAVYSGSG